MKVMQHRLLPCLVRCVFGPKNLLGKSVVFFVAIGFHLPDNRVHNGVDHKATNR